MTPSSQQRLHSSVPAIFQHPPSAGIPRAYSLVPRLHNSLKENQYMIEYNCNPILNLCNAHRPLLVISAYKSTQHEESFVFLLTTSFQATSYFSSSCCKALLCASAVLQRSVTVTSHLLPCPIHQETALNREPYGRLSQS